MTAMEITVKKMVREMEMVELSGSMQAGDDYGPKSK
jgi:hypothetical protein